MQKVKISYPTRFKEGTHYDQMVSVQLTGKELDDFNRFVNLSRYQYKNHRQLGIEPTYERYQDWLYLQNLSRGDNFAKLTTRDRFMAFFNIQDKRFLNRNTVLRIKIIKPKADSPRLPLVY